MQKLTQSMGNSAKGYVDANKDENLQAVCETLGGLASGEGEGTWTAATSLTIADTRVVSTSKILISPVTNAPIGFWYVSARSTGSFTITSTETETAGTKVHYIVINN